MELLKRLLNENKKTELSVCIEGTEWRHLKRGTVYIAKGAANLQLTGTEHDMKLAIVYADKETETDLWVRDAEEFLDGRFELIKEEEESH